MHSVLQDEWEEAAPEVGYRVSVQYSEKRSGEDFDYHMWSAKVDRTETGNTEAGSPEETTAAGSNPTANEERPQDFDGSELYGPPAVESDRSEGESVLDDPNGALPF